MAHRAHVVERLAKLPGLGDVRLAVVLGPLVRVGFTRECLGGTRHGKSLVLPAKLSCPPRPSSRSSREAARVPAPSRELTLKSVACRQASRRSRASSGTSPPLMRTFNIFGMSRMSRVGSPHKACGTFGHGRGFHHFAAQLVDQVRNRVRIRRFTSNSFSTNMPASLPFIDMPASGLRRMALWMTHVATTKNFRSRYLVHRTSVSWSGGKTLARRNLRNPYDCHPDEQMFFECRDATSATHSAQDRNR